ncbi:MAG: hypothetical protein GYA85_10530 [Propionibacterium sp.]|nr:hypothetical protein [Propionibacterium sp.]
MNRNESEDARFEALMAREFPLGLVPAEGGRRPSEEPEPPVTSTQDAPAAPSPDEALATDFRSWAPPEEAGEEFVPPPAPPARRWSAAGIAGTALVVLPLVLVVATGFGLRLPMLVSVLTGAGFFLGVWLLLHRLRQRPPIDGDGAVV